MKLEMLAMWVLVGLSAGWLGRFAMADARYGLIEDIILGLGGSIVAGGMVWVLGVFPGAGLLVMVPIAFVGAASVIVAQREFWHARRSV